MSAEAPTVLLIAPFPPTRAPEADKAYYLCRALADHGWRVHVATTTGSVDADHPRATVHRLVRDWTWADAAALVNLAEETIPDLVLLLYIDWLYNYHPMATFLPSLVRARRPGLEIVTIFDDVSLVLPWEQAFPVRLSRQRTKQWAGLTEVDDRYGTLLRDSDRVVVVSGRVGARLARYHAGLEEKMVVVPTPPILRMAPAEESARKRWRDLLGVKPPDTLLAYFGYLSQGKGIETLLRAFALLCRRRQDLHLVLIGGTYPEPEHVNYARVVRALPDHLGIQGKVYWTGEYAWDSDEASQFLRAADACVLPYDAGVCVHNSSFVCVAAHGLPIVTTRGPGLEEQFLDGENVFLVTPEDPPALAKAIQAVLEDGPLRQRLRAGVRDLVREWFTWDRALERMGLLLPRPAAPEAVAGRR